MNEVLIGVALQSNDFLAFRNNELLPFAILIALVPFTLGNYLSVRIFKHEFLEIAIVDKHLHFRNRSMIINFNMLYLLQILVLPHLLVSLLHFEARTGNSISEMKLDLDD